MTDHQMVLRLDHRGVVAEGIKRDQAFLVLAGSCAVEDWKLQRCMTTGDREIYRGLVEAGVLVKRFGESLRFTRDYYFASMSSAANVITGSHINGDRYWSPGRQIPRGSCAI